VRSMTRLTRARRLTKRAIFLPKPDIATLLDVKLSALSAWATTVFNGESAHVSV